MSVRSITGGLKGSTKALLGDRNEVGGGGHMTHQGSKYRQDIQGLRAVAVGAIVIFHAFPAALPGGFVGVDIFFVISGFLITGIIYRDIERGSFSLAEFYRKRVRRIFPALFVMLAITLGVGYLLLSPEAYGELGRNTLSSVFFLSNVDFWQTSGYFDRAAEFRPLLHTWSLAVEEQFYIVFPIFVLVVMRLARNMLVGLLVLVFVISLALSEWALSEIRIGIGAYFLTPFRVYELLLGSIAAIAPTLGIFNRPAVRNVSVAMGLIMILVAVALFSPQVRFPGVNALLPTVGAALILYAGRAGDSLPARLLTPAPLLFIGAISYSLYLWHWPVYAYLRILSQPGHPEPFTIIIATALVIVLAAFSYRFVEQPIANRDTAKTPFLTLGGVGMCASALIAGIIWQSGGVPSRFTPDTLQMFAAAKDISPERQRCHRGPRRDMPYETTCVLGAPDIAPNTVIWADSHGVELAYALAEFVAPSKRAVRQITGSACPPVVDLDLPSRPSCQAANEQIIQALSGDDTVNRVILMMNAEGYMNDESIAFEDLHSSLNKAVAHLRMAGKEIVLIAQLPNARMDAPSIAGLTAYKGGNPSEIGVPRSEIDKLAADWNAALQAMAGQDGIDFVDLTPQLCGPAICPIVSNGDVMYFNGAHISMTAARRIAPALVDGS
ncbi:MAG: acyltransferase family protein [Roseobacter sp.]